MGRFVNDSPESLANSIAQRKVVKNVPRIIIMSKRDITCGEELT